MRDRLRRTYVSACAAATVVGLLLSPLLAQDLPSSGEPSFEVEPPLLIKPWESEHPPDESQEETTKAPLDPAKLIRQLRNAKEDAASASRLAKIGVLAKVEAEQRELRVVRLQSELAHAQMIAAQEQVTSQKARFVIKMATQSEVDYAVAALASATAAAQAAEETYHKAELEAAELNLSRQRQLLKLGSARKSDVARAEEKVTKLQQGDQAPP